MDSDLISVIMMVDSATLLSRIEEAFRLRETLGSKKRYDKVHTDSKFHVISQLGNTFSDLCKNYLEASVLLRED